jgi:hypothetical protein
MNKRAKKRLLIFILLINRRRPLIVLVALAYDKKDRSTGTVPASPLDLSAINAVAAVSLRCSASPSDVVRQPRRRRRLARDRRRPSRQNRQPTGRKTMSPVQRSVFSYSVNGGQVSVFYPYA